MDEDLSLIEGYFASLGLIAAWWNRAESELDDILTCMIGDTKKAHILTDGTSITRRAAFVKRLCEESYATEPWKDVMIAALEAFDVLRQNRNVLIHSTAANLDPKEGAAELLVRTKNPNRRITKIVRVNSKQVDDELRLVAAMGNHLRQLRSHIFHLDGAVKSLSDLLSPRAALPDKFALPELLQSPQSPTHEEPVIRRVPRSDQEER